jgi:hypothetical protein
MYKYNHIIAYHMTVITQFTTKILNLISFPMMYDHLKYAVYFLRTF